MNLFNRSHEFCEIVLCVSIKNAQYRGVEQLVARQAHNLEVGGPNPSSATTEWECCSIGSFLSLEI